MSEVFNAENRGIRKFFIERFDPILDRGISATFFGVAFLFAEWSMGNSPDFWWMLAGGVCAGAILGVVSTLVNMPKDKDLSLGLSLSLLMIATGILIPHEPQGIPLNLLCAIWIGTCILMAFPFGRLLVKMSERVSKGGEFDE